MIRGCISQSVERYRSNLKALNYDKQLHGQSEGSCGLVCKLSHLISDME